VSSKGRSYTWFRKALEHGDLTTVRSSLVDLPPLTLGDALSVTLLICEREPENAERAARPDPALTGEVRSALASRRL
jgi:hypothetical protein